MISSTNFKHLTCMTFVLANLGLVLASAVHDPAKIPSTAIYDSPALRIISDEDQTSMQHIKIQIEDEFANFKTINEVHAFLDRVKLLVQKHPKNVAFAQGDMRDLHKFLSQDIVTRLIRVDTDPFIMPIADEMIPIAQRAIDEDELARKLFSGPLRSMIEAKRQQVSQNNEGNHKDGNFFSNFWCRISGGCSN